MIETTPEYTLGRNGEILLHSFAIEHGCTTFDIGGTANGRAPLLNSPFGNSIAPDALHIRNIPVWAEYKTKTNTFDWRGGSRDMEVRMPPCLMHGIERRAFEEYQLADQKMPVVLWFLTINTGFLHIASLEELGDPFASVDPRWNMVNWPVSRMMPVARFDTNRLWQYFRHKRSFDRLPSLDERKELLWWLRPQQIEFDGFVEHFLISIESRWKR